MEKVAVIMAGGTGSKLWPLATESVPKQFVHISGEGTMLQNTFMRLMPMYPLENIFVVVLESMKEIVEEQLPLLKKENIVCEPFGKHTAPCLALTETVLKDRFSEDTVMTAYPADHLISNIQEFQASVETAVELAASRNCVATIAVKPTRPIPDFGYVQIRDSAAGIEEFYSRGVRYCTSFAEKPDVGTAKRFIESGDFFWNTGIYSWTLKTFRKLFKQFLPEDFALFAGLHDRQFSEILPEELNYIYKNVKAVSLDYSILEKAGNVLVVEADFEWSDFGNWNEIFRKSMKDSRNNVVQGNIISFDNSGCFISSSDSLVAAVGLKDLLIIEHNGAIMICNRNDAEAVNKIEDYLRFNRITQFI